MRRRDHWYALSGDIDPQSKAALICLGEMPRDQIIRLITDIQVHALCAQAFHLKIDGASDDVSGCQLPPLIEARHEPVPVGEGQRGAFSPQCLGHEKRSAVCVVKAGRMELVELHVGDPAAGAPCGGNAVTTGPLGVGRIAVGLTGPASSQHNGICPHGFDAIIYGAQ